MWTEVPKGKNKKPVNKDRFISKMFLRLVIYFIKVYMGLIYNATSGDSVILGTLTLVCASTAFLTDARQSFGIRHRQYELPHLHIFSCWLLYSKCLSLSRQMM